MAIDYQHILMEMNRPSRRPARSIGKLIFGGVICLALGGGAFAAWRSGVAGEAWSRGARIAESAWALASSWNRGGADAGTDSANPPGDVSAPSSLPAVPTPAPSGPISVADAARAVPSAPAGAAGAFRQAPADLVALAKPAASTSLRPPPSSAAPGPAAGAAATPVLSDARAQLRAIDQLLAENPAEALRRVESLIRTSLTDEEAAEAGYRLGYAARMVRDEEKAEKSWRETAEKWPALRGGRYSALALADTWFHLYATARPQISYWDDIQILYSRVLGMDDAPFLPDEARAKVKANLAIVNDAILFGSGPTKLARYHKVETGELLGGIAGKYRTDYESIARINGINPDRIRVGMDLKILVGETAIVVRKNSGDPGRGPTLTWFLDGRWMREYPACVGDGNKTPAGSYSLVSKERDPSWTNPVNGQLLPNNHPENILGSRWMAMKGMNTQGLGIHGTTVDDSVPGYTSAGCVRLLNRDVEELFSYAGLGAKVVVIE